MIWDLLIETLILDTHRPKQLYSDLRNIELKIDRDDGAKNPLCEITVGQARMDFAGDNKSYSGHWCWMQVQCIYGVHLLSGCVPAVELDILCGVSSVQELIPPALLTCSSPACTSVVEQKAVTSQPAAVTWLWKDHVTCHWCHALLDNNTRVHLLAPAITILQEVWSSGNGPEGLWKKACSI